MKSTDNQRKGDKANKPASPAINRRELPLFALQTWLFPHVPLALQVFEARYLNMISRQLKRADGFGVVAIRQGREVGRAAVIADVGVEVKVTDWRQQANGLLGITVYGERAFKILGQRVEPDQLIVAEVEFLPSEQAQALDDSVSGLVDLLAQLKEHPVIQQLGLPDVDTTSELSWQLAQILPLAADDKARLLAMHDAGERIAALSVLVRGLSQGD